MTTFKTVKIDLRSEYKNIIWFVSIFLFIYFLPIDQLEFEELDSTPTLEIPIQSSKIICLAKNYPAHAKEMGVEIIGRSVSKKKQVISALKKLLPQVDAFWLISDPELMSTKEDLLNILQECNTQQVPVFSYHEAFADFGAILIVSADNPTKGRQAAGIVREVLAGSKLEEKVQFPAGSYMVMNLKKVKQYALHFNFRNRVLWAGSGALGYPVPEKGCSE